MQTQLCLTPNDQGRHMTLEEFESAASQEGYVYELIDGRLEVSPQPNLPHDDIKDWLLDLLKDYSKEHPDMINKVKGPARVFVPGRRAATAPEPDIAAYQGYPYRLPRSLRSWRDIGPVLVVEILSEDNAKKDLVRNRKLYLEVPSIREYWILDPRDDADRPRLAVYRRNRRRWQRPIHIAAGDSYTTDLLPGFVLALVEGPEAAEDDEAT